MVNHVSLVAAGIVLNEEKNKILLIKRSDKMWGNAWSIPGGRVEFGENVEDSLRRELKEELGINVRSARFLSYQEFTPPGKPDTMFVSLNFIVISNEKFSVNDEIEEARWFSAVELGKIKHEIPISGLKYLRRTPYGPLPGGQKP